MLARLQRTIVWLLLAGLISWLGVCLALGAYGWSWMGPLFLVAGYVLVLGFEFAWMRSTYAAADARLPSPAQLLRSWWAEASIAPMVFLWWQPFRSRLIPDRSGPDYAGRRGVVFVHGFFCNRGIWTQWLAKLNGPFIAVDLEPLFGSIDQYVATIDEAIRRMKATTGVAPVVVAHSMGGLAVRAWLASSGRDVDVHRVVTIATPHGGTALARVGGARNTAQMAVGSRWLKELAAREDPLSHSRFICFWGHCDNVVFPNRLAMLAGADNRHLDSTPHVSMVFHPDIFSVVVSLADDASPAAEPTPTSSVPRPPPPMS